MEEVLRDVENRVRDRLRLVLLRRLLAVTHKRAHDVEHAVEVHALELDALLVVAVALLE